MLVYSTQTQEEFKQSTRGEIRMHVSYGLRSDSIRNARTSVFDVIRDVIVHKGYGLLTRGDDVDDRLFSVPLGREGTAQGDLKSFLRRLTNAS